MSFAVNNGVRFTAGRGEETWVPGTGTFAGLDDDDRHTLSDWLDRAGMRGIDTAMDLSARPWGISDADAIVGVFEAGKDTASWLIVRSRFKWVLARCPDCFISDEMESLPAILALIESSRALGG
jgi:hypothetical protein